MAARKAAPAAQAAEAVPERPDFEVVGDELVCHPYGDLRLSLVIPMATHAVYLEVNDTAATWPEQIAGWRERVMPAEVLEAIDREGERDFAAAIILARKWSWGLDVRLGKALS